MLVSAATVCPSHLATVTTVAANSNENSVVTLADGKSVMSVWRMGAGDGLIWNK